MTTQTDQLLVDLDYLEGVGLTLEQLRRLHHWSGRPEADARVTFKSVRDYFSKGQAMQTNNTNFAVRLNALATLHKAGLAGLVERALAQHPR